jgi:hypothetical protein
MLDGNKDTPHNDLHILIAEGQAAVKRQFELRDTTFDSFYHNVLTVSFANYYLELNTPDQSLLQSKLSSLPLIDLGGGKARKKLQEFFHIPKYTTVDLQAFTEKTDTYEDKNMDALEFVLTQQSNSANVMANGFITKDMGLSASYWNALFTQIDKIVPPQGIFVGVYFDLPQYMPEGFAMWTPETHGFHNKSVQVFEKLK